MFTLEFDETIDSTLSPDPLWRLVVEAFESSEESPLWPSDLETLELESLERGARVRGTYHLGPVSAELLYRIGRVERGRSFSYETLDPHPLRGGAIVSIEARPHGGSVLRWRGSYRPRHYPKGLAALLFVRGYFLTKFFSRLRENLHAFERNRDVEPTDLRGVEPGEMSLHAKHTRSKDRG